MNGIMKVYKVMSIKEQLQKIQLKLNRQEKFIKDQKKLRNKLNTYQVL